MPVPDFQSMMLPVLEILSDGSQRRNVEVRNELARRLQLTEAEVAEMLPSGNQKRFHNRVAWSLVYLAKAGLISRPQRGHCMITDVGRELLNSPPDRISIRFLTERYDGVRQLRSGGDEPEVIPTPGIEPIEPPEETLDANYRQIREALAAELLEQIKSCSPAFFEKLVIDVLVAMGYGGSRGDAARAVGRPGDGGIDGIIKEDRLGLDQVYVQAKRWENTVGRPAVQAFTGSLEGFRARKGIMITTSGFSREAEEYVTQIEKRIILVDGPTLAEYMIDHGVGVTETARYVLHKIDADYFEDQ